MKFKNFYNDTKSVELQQPDNTPEPSLKDRLKVDTFMDHDVYEVDHETYCKCANGKRNGDRWLRYIDDPDTRDMLKKEYWKKRNIILQSSTTKNLVFLRKNRM